jgi:chromatin remodeling complex protein RSC6
MTMATAKPAAKKPAAKKPAAAKPAAKPAAKNPAAAKAPAAKAPAAKAPAAKAAAVKAAPAKKPAAKKAAATTARKPNAAFMKELTPSPELSAVVGSNPLPRTEVVKKMWEYIRKHGLQDAAKRTMINADDALKKVFKKAQVSMFEMTKLVNQHLK